MYHDIFFFYNEATINKFAMETVTLLLNQPLYIARIPFSRLLLDALSVGYILLEVLLFDYNILLESFQLVSLSFGYIVLEAMLVA